MEMKGKELVHCESYEQVFSSCNEWRCKHQKSDQNSSEVEVEEEKHREKSSFNVQPIENKVEEGYFELSSQRRCQN